MLRADIAAKIGRLDLSAASGAPTGTAVDYQNATGPAFGISGGVAFGGGRDSLILLAVIVAGLFAFGYWTR